MCTHLILLLEVNKSQCIGEGRGHNLTINRIKRTGAGVYVCAAKNTVGESSNSVDVLVQCECLAV